jgi:hypothetical protein
MLFNSITEFYSTGHDSWTLSGGMCQNVDRQTSVEERMSVDPTLMLYLACIYSSSHKALTLLRLSEKYNLCLPSIISGVGSTNHPGIFQRCGERSILELRFSLLVDGICLT